jgi:hypothetical protein
MSAIRTQEEKEQIKKSVGDQIYIKVTLQTIKRDPKCE